MTRRNGEINSPRIFTTFCFYVILVHCNILSLESVLIIAQINVLPVSTQAMAINFDGLSSVEYFSKSIIRSNASSIKTEIAGDNSIVINWLLWLIFLYTKSLKYYTGHDGNNFKIDKREQIMSALLVSVRVRYFRIRERFSRSNSPGHPSHTYIWRDASLQGQLNVGWFILTCPTVNEYKE